MMTKRTDKISHATEETAESKGRKPRATTLYPKVTLVDALRLAESIRDNNAGRPYNRIDLAASVDLSPESSTLRTLITASNKFGLTEGSYAAEKIGLTDLGHSIVSPTSDEERAQGLMAALYKVDFYKDFFERYKNHRLPRKDLLLNTLEREFGIPVADRDQCYELLVKNATELGLLKDVGGTPYIRFDHPTVAVGPEIDDDDTATREETESPASPPANNRTPAPEPCLPVKGPTDAATTHKPKIFISHSKNMKILTQIKSNLEFGGFSYKVAIETETTAIPIPEKIFGMMRDCNCAIVNVSADEQERREDGSYGINANVLVEIGAAFLAYNQRVILLVDKRLTLPSNLQGLYRCEYTGDELDSGAVTRLQKGLLQFRVPVD
jgi:CAP12/Pycsar effector protein, TIR domain